MTDRLDTRAGSQARVYQIRLQGHLGSQGSIWFDGFEILLENNGDTLLTGTVRDQAALHGLFRKIRDLALPLLSVMGMPSDQQTTFPSSLPANDVKGKTNE